MLMSEKYDGVRAIWNGESMRSRVDKAFYPPVWFTENLPNWIALDGELFTERGKFQNTVSIVKKISPVNQEWRKITFNVFDSPTLSGTYMERYTQLQSIIKDIPYVKLVTQTRVTSDKQMEELYKKVLEKGGEGLVLRNPSMNYIKKRTKDLLKVKPTDDNEGIIINMIEGKGKDTGRMGALVVELKNNRSIKFKIGTGFTDALRQNFWNKKQNYKNRLVTFSYKGLTNAGKPRHPVYVRMRNLQ
jgi:DNA ligase-1